MLVTISISIPTEWAQDQRRDRGLLLNRVKPPKRRPIILKQSQMNEKHNSQVKGVATTSTIARNWAIHSRLFSRCLIGKLPLSRLSIKGPTFDFRGRDAYRNLKNVCQIENI